MRPRTACDDLQEIVTQKVKKCCRSRGKWFGEYLVVLTSQIDAPTDEWICSFVIDQQYCFWTGRPL